ncbi:hypothetical protein Q7P37_009872 [Cladosporium fusiforme]
MLWPLQFIGTEGTDLHDTSESYPAATFVCKIYTKLQHSCFGSFAHQNDKGQWLWHETKQLLVLIFTGIAKSLETNAKSLTALGDGAAMCDSLTKNADAVSPKEKKIGGSMNLLGEEHLHALTAMEDLATTHDNHTR